MNALIYVFSAAAAYLIGSFSPSIFLSEKVLHSDVRAEGSGNAGATNMARVHGLGFGVVTLLCDFIKAMLAIALCRWLTGDWGLFTGGLFCLVGHCFPVYYQFKGGKGISVGAAVALAIGWPIFLAVVLTFALGAGLSRKVSVGSVLAALAIVPAVFFFQVSLPGKVLGICSMLLVIWRHRENIVRVAEGKEPDFRAAKEDKLANLIDKNQK